MQNLRDKLLKAGKVSKKDKRRADQNARQRRKQNKGHVESAEAENRRSEIYARNLAEQQARNAAHDEARRLEKASREQRLRVGHIVDFYCVNLRRGRVRWYFMARDKKVHFVEVTDQTAWQLSRGELAIVERPQLDGAVESYLAVPAPTARMLWDISDEYVRFFNRSDPEPARWWEGDFPAIEAASGEPDTL